MLAKAAEDDFLGRFREIVSDPLNLLVRRVPDAGGLENGCVILHNGHRVPFEGPQSYYEAFSRILVINRGVHEPLEEYVFQELLGSPGLRAAPVMLELGAYWGHYSMWMKQARPQASVHLVEPDPDFLAAGESNFQRNGYAGTFVQDLVGNGHFRVADYLKEISAERLDVLHSDIQGNEVEMLDGCDDLLRRSAIDYVFISTHSQALHMEVVRRLQAASYRVEVSSDFNEGTTACDGLVFASSPGAVPVLPGFIPPQRARIAVETPADLLKGLNAALARPRSA